jgi:hypothetical protein
VRETHEAGAVAELFTPDEDLAMNMPTAAVVGVGAERGLGAALCRRFAAEGYHLFDVGTE